MNWIIKPELRFHFGFTDGKRKVRNLLKPLYHKDRFYQIGYTIGFSNEFSNSNVAWDYFQKNPEFNVPESVNGIIFNS